MINMSDENWFKTLSPGRINLIGEHTDHQKGFVLPAAINRSIEIYVNPRKDKLVKVYSKTMEESDEFDFNVVYRDYGWKNYVRGVVKKFHYKFQLKSGYNIIITSNLPVGSGLSSSAALEVGLYTTLEKINGLDLPDLEVIKDCWDVENKFVGISCGIMDQFIVRVGKKNSAIKLNCRDLGYSFIKIPSKIKFLVIETGIGRSLKDSPYNQRIKECENALKKLNESGFKIGNLSQLKLEDMGLVRDKLGTNLLRRVEHVVSENHRVQVFEEKIINSASEAGKLLYESHESLRYNFQASWEEADDLVAFSKSIFGAYGARMVGAGWGGSVLLMIDSKESDNIQLMFKKRFRQKKFQKYSIYEISISDGVKFQEIDKELIPFNQKNLF
jgi:galactokinase